MKPTIASQLVRLYPRSWREQYGEEFQDLLEGERANLATLFDVGQAAAVEQFIYLLEQGSGAMQTYVKNLPLRLSDAKLGLIVGVLLSAAILVTNVLLPVIIGHPTQDTELTESLGWILVISLIAYIGFLRVRRASSVREAALAGGIVSFVGFGIAMATFLLIDNLFLNIVSQQPEKIWLFQHSGYPDMRTYLNHTNLRAFWTVLPIIAVLGAVCGGAGGLLHLLVRRSTS